MLIKHYWHTDGMSQGYPDRMKTSESTHMNVDLLEKSYILQKKERSLSVCLSV